jgi:hypothetical protein
VFFPEGCLRAFSFCDGFVFTIGGLSKHSISAEVHQTNNW